MQLRFCTPSLALSSLVFVSACGGSSTSSDHQDGSMAHDMASAGDMASVGAGDMTPGGDMTAVDLGPHTNPTTLAFVAGGLGGAGSANGSGVVARFTTPYGVATDGTQSLYIVDQGGCTIRKMDLATGAVTTLAGGFGQGASVDGTGADARFSNPSGAVYGVTPDGKKNLYVTDTFNNTIRVVNTDTAEVTTLAGTAGAAPDPNSSGDGTGAGARFSSPNGVSIDSTGSNLYVTDSFNYTIRRVGIATGIVTTIAGVSGMSGSTDCTTNCTPSSSLFNNPQGVAYQKTGAQEILYVADTSFFGAGAVRQVNIANHKVVTVADQNGPVGFSGPSGVAFDGAGNLYVAVANDDVIDQLNPTTGAVTLLAGSVGQAGNSDGVGAAASFYGPEFFVFDSANNLYVADSVNNMIRKVATTGADLGKVTTVAGAVATIGTEDGVGDVARFSTPSGLTGDGADNLYVADSDNNTIRRVAISTGRVDTIAGTAGVFPDFGMNGDGTGLGALFSSPTGIAYVKSSDGKAHLYVADTSNDLIRQLDLDTMVVSTLAGTAGVPPDAGKTGDGTGADALFNFPTGLVHDGQGNLYVADTNDNTIRKVVLATKVVTTVVGSDAGLGAPQGVAFDGPGHLYFSDASSATIQQVDLATGQVSLVAGMQGETGYVDAMGTDARFNFPTTMAADGAGNVYIVEAANNAIRKLVLSSGAVSTFAGTPGSIGVLLGPLPGGLNMPTAVFANSPSEVAISDENSILLAR